MISTTTSNRGSRRRGRRAKALSAVAVATVAGLAGAAPALASPPGPQNCSGDNGQTHTICLDIDPVGSNNDWNVHVGIDLYMTPGYARLLTQCGPGFIRAELWGNDGADAHDFLKHIPLSPGWPAVGDTGLGAEFDIRVDRRVLDEDDGRDEVYAKVLLWDCNIGVTRTFTSGGIEHSF